MLHARVGLRFKLAAGLGEAWTSDGAFHGVAILACILLWFFMSHGVGI